MKPKDLSAGTMRVTADRGACCGYGVCAEICPEIFKLDDAGIVFLDSEIVPADLIERATEAVQACPQQALGVEPFASGLSPRKQAATDPSRRV